ncbi:quercetin dioxygenase-like cupin family protein [Catenulispora sp. EB89]|uniref:cupin domain-containing protein n=1 Tax=Catenulispora sp. EB89 TaxID=3156257 RepID=UPI003510FB17
MANHADDNPGLYPPVLIRADEAEHLPSIGHFLLADADSTRGALSTHRVALATGADSAVPHYHSGSSELFYILDGRLDVLVGSSVQTADAGDLLVVPPGLNHAFGAHAGSTAEALIVITPGVQRFDYFHLVVRTRAGLEAPETLRASQERFDTYFVESEVWQEARHTSIE